MLLWQRSSSSLRPSEYPRLRVRSETFLCLGQRSTGLRARHTCVRYRTTSRPPPPLPHERTSPSNTAPPTQHSSLSRSPTSAMERSWPHAQQQQRTTSEDGESARQHTASATSRRSSVAIYCREDADNGDEQPVHDRSSAESHYDARYDSGAEVLGRERGRDISGREYGAWDQHDTCGVGARMQTAPANHCQPSDSSHRSVHRHQFSLSADAAALHVAASGYGETAINARGAVFRSPHDQSASKVVPMPLPYSRDRSSSQSRRDQRSLLWFDGEGVDRETTSRLEEKEAAGEASSRPAGLQSSGWFATASEQHIPLQQMKTSSLRGAAVADEPKPAEQETLTSAAVGRTREGKRRARECRVDGCTNFIIKMGVCFRHGVRWMWFYHFVVGF